MEPAPISAASHLRWHRRLRQRAARRATARCTCNRSGIMTDDGRDRFEIPKEMRALAEASFDQARKAFENFLGSAQQAASGIEGKGDAVRASAKDVSARAVAYAEKNVAASLEYAQQLLHAKDLSDVMRLHTEYV